MEEKRSGTTVQSDRWSYLWLLIGTLLSYTTSERVTVAQVPARGGVFTLYPVR